MGAKLHRGGSQVHKLRQQEISGANAGDADATVDGAGTSARSVTESEKILWHIHESFGGCGGKGVTSTDPRHVTCPDCLEVMDGAR